MLHIFYLGQSWIEHLDVVHEEADIYSFDHGNYTIRLVPSRSKEKVQQDIVIELIEEIQPTQEDPQQIT